MPAPTMDLLTRPGPYPSPLAIEEIAAPVHPSPVRLPSPPEGEGPGMRGGAHASDTSHVNAEAPEAAAPASSAGVRVFVPAPPPRTVACPACGEPCELAPMPNRPSSFHLLDPGTSAKGIAAQRYLGNHRCPQLEALRRSRPPRYRTRASAISLSPFVSLSPLEGERAGDRGVNARAKEKRPSVEGRAPAGATSGARP